MKIMKTWLFTNPGPTATCSLYVYIHTHIHMLIYACTPIYRYTYVHIRRHRRRHIHSHRHIQVHVYIRVKIRRDLHVVVFICISLHVKFQRATGLLGVGELPGCTLGVNRRIRKKARLICRDIEPKIQGNRPWRWHTSTAGYVWKEAHSKYQAAYPD